MVIFNQGTLKVFLIFELEIHLVCSINLKKWVARVKLTKIKDGGTVFRGFVQFMAWFIALEKVLRNRRDAFVREKLSTESTLPHISVSTNTKKNSTVMPSQVFFLIQPMDASGRLISSSAQRPMRAFVSKKPQFCVFQAIKETLLSAILELFTETTIKIPCNVVSMLVILTMFRCNFAGSILRYERLFESNMFQM